jgi:hypothetical protein
MGTGSGVRLGRVQMGVLGYGIALASIYIYIYIYSIPEGTTVAPA